MLNPVGPHHSDAHISPNVELPEDLGGSRSAKQEPVLLALIPGH